MAPAMARTIDDLPGSGRLAIAPPGEVDAESYDMVVNCTGPAPVGSRRASWPASVADDGPRVAPVTDGRADLGMPSLRRSQDVLPDPAQYLLEGHRSCSLSVFNLGLACCAVEFVAASMARPDLVPITGARPPTPDAERLEVMVVSGTVTDKMVPAVRRLYEEMPEPKYVLSFGSCANSGGPYWDSYCVTKGVDQIIPVDVYVPGCPPRPEALVHAIAMLQDKIDGGRR
jgi:NADH-quinone oxidoreductase subunit B